ncbi:hypothetical protein ACFVXG_22290 [Kitasatospora sp. NPDC058162]|uniref:hypothetical protein n=1 Tax=Kitasatospora sp. NPDC058162 TaxID=3346362 RepID=UPI0036D96790
MILDSGPSEALLRLELVSDPPQFAVSTPGRTEEGTLQLTFSKPGDGTSSRYYPGDPDTPVDPNAPAVKCRKITVSLPIGPDATDLTDNPAAIDPGFHDSKGTPWRVTPATSGTEIVFTCVPDNPTEQVTFEGVRRFTLILGSIPINPTPGDVQLTVVEETATGNDWKPRSLVIPAINKSGSIFFFRRFSALRPRVERGKAATLIWDGSHGAGTTYYLSWDAFSGTKVVSGSSYVTHELTETTTFVLDARTRSSTGQVIHHLLSTTVIVKDSDVRAAAMTVRGTLRTDRIRPITFPGLLQISGPVLAHGDLSIGRGGTLYTRNISGKNQSPIDIAANVSTGADLLRVAGQFQLKGSADLIGAGTLYTLRVGGKAGPITARSAGLVIGWAELQRADWIASMITIEAGGRTVHASATKNATPSSSPEVACTAVLAVRPNESFTITHHDEVGNNSNPTLAHFYWIPFGFAGAGGASTPSGPDTAADGTPAP